MATLGSKTSKPLLVSFLLTTLSLGLHAGETGAEELDKVIKDGDFAVSTSGPGGEPVTLANLRGGDFFGEIALISDQPRTATVTALTGGRLMSLSREDFNRVAESHPGVLEVARAFLQKRAEETISTIMTLDEGGLDELVI